MGPPSFPKLFYFLLVESDKGSTDSEVRKILTLHIPITEYDTLGSESDTNSTQRAAAAAAGVVAQPANQSQKYRSQRGIGRAILTTYNIVQSFVDEPLEVWEIVSAYLIWEICLLRVFHGSSL